MADMLYPIAYADLCANLGFYDTPIPEAQRQHLLNKLEAAALALNRDHGITVDPADLADSQLQSLYAQWLYKGQASGADKPPMLAAMLRNAAVLRAKASREVQG